MFSSRLYWDLKPNPITELVREKRRQGVTFLDLTESNPTNARLDYPAQMLDAFRDPRALRYEPDPRGSGEARSLVARYYADRGVFLFPSQILLTASTSEAYSYLFKLLTDSGDEVLSPRPSYPLFEFLATLESVRIVPYLLEYHGKWRIDFGALEMAATPRSRAVVLVNPNNPTGSFLKTDELEELASFCERRGLAILSDEVFADYGFGEAGGRVQTLAGLDRVPVFVMSGLSKIAGLPQMKLGWIAVNGPEQIRKQAMERLELIADTYLSVATPVQVALEKLLESGESVRAQITSRTAANLAFLRSAIAAESPVSLLDVEGGWYATLQVPRTRSEEQWVLTLLNERNLLVQPGYYYDFASEAFLVVSLLTPPDVFEAGVGELLKAVSAADGDPRK